jgi:predicted RNA-binding protein with PIN domain
MYLIDGNNVMGQRPGWHRDKRAAQLRLLSEVAELSRRQGTQMSVVFDGGPLDNFPDGARYRGVCVFYARRGSSADDRILELVEQSSNRHNLTVVTSDRALVRRVEAHGVKTIRSGQLRTRLDSLGPESPEQIEVRDKDLPEWLRYFGVEANEGLSDDDPD